MFSALILLSSISVVVYTLARIVYNLYFHPLSKFPGPKLWATTALVRYSYTISGRFDWELKALHEKYGEVVRYSPDELSFTNEHAWRDIYARKPHPLVKDPVMYDAIKIGSDGASSIFNASEQHHPRIRKQLALGFSERALRNLEPVTQEYIDLLITRLREMATAGENADMVKWINFATFDMIGELAMGKPFGCLRERGYHSWVANLQNGVKIGPYIRMIATYTDVKRLWRLLAPKSVREARQQHEQFVRLNTRERLARGGDSARVDFLSYIIEEDGGKDAMHPDEVAANAGFLIIAGSEAAATAMSGILFHLLRNSAAAKLLIDEIRGAFGDESEIDFSSTAAKLPYLMACISEGMRIFPPGPTLPPRRTPRGQMTEIAGYVVPGWTSVGVHPLSATASPVNFHRPDEFLPERWLPAATQDSSSPFFHDKRQAVQPFSVGPRSCLGKGLAYNEMRVILARIFWNFDLVLQQESQNWDKQNSYTLWEKPELWCRLSNFR